MTDIELLISTGLSDKVARQLLANLGTMREVASASATDLVVAGAPTKTATKIASAFSVGRRIESAKAPITIGRGVDVHDLLRERAAGLTQEIFWVIPIDIRNGLIGDAVEVARGTICGVEVHPREVFKVGVRVSAAGVVLAHNHPSGDPTPSDEDIELTKRLREVGRLIGIPVIDHVVIGAQSFRSIAEWMGTAF